MTVFEYEMVACALWYIAVQPTCTNKWDVIFTLSGVGLFLAGIVKLVMS